MRDFRYAIRFLWSHKAFAAAGILTLAIGLGANTALYGLIGSTLRPLALPHPEQIASIVAEAKGDDTGGFQFGFSVEQMKDFQEHADSFSDVVGIMPRMGGFTANGQAWPFWFGVVSNNYFHGLGVRPAAGTLFNDRSGSPVHVVLGHSFWLRHFGGSPNVIGTTVRVDGAPAIITGVVEPAFRGTMVGVEIDGYVEIDDFRFLSPDAERWLYNDRKVRGMQLFGRLKPDASMSSAQDSVNALMTTLAAEHPDTDQGLGAVVVPEPLARPLPMRAVRETIPYVRVFGLVVGGIVLLLACMNVGNLLLVRATARQREMAIRAALGASRFRLVRQMSVEGLVLSIVGGLAGYLAGQWVSDAFISRLDLGADLPLHFDTSFDLNVFLFSVGAALLAGLLIGVWPAWRSSRSDVRGALHDGGKSHSTGAERQKMRRILVVGQISGALALLIVAGLFVRTLASAQHIDLGFDADKLISVRLDPRQIGYDEDRTTEFYRDLERRVRAWPDVESAALSFAPPMSYLLIGGFVYIEGRPVEAGVQPQASFFNRAGQDYFDVMGIPIVRGRPFTEDDEHERATTRRHAIVNESFAHLYWPGQDPIGKRFRMFSLTEPVLDVVGVARDSKYVLVFESARPYVYLPIERDTTMRTLLVRASDNPAALRLRLEQEIQRLAPNMPISDLRTMRESLNGVFGFLVFRVGAIQTVATGILGLMLAIVGVYGVVSFDASLRTREIGIRTALGAQSRDILRLVLGRGLVLVIGGIGIGVAIGIALSRVLSRFMPLVNATDYWMFAFVGAGLSALALLACYLPARRATKVPVTTALRHE